LGIVTKYINGYTIHTYEDTPIEKILNPVKSASVKSEEISSWARLYKLQNDESEIKSAATEEHQTSSWARLHQLRS